MSSNPLELAAREDFSKAEELPDLSQVAQEEHSRQLISLADSIKSANYPGREASLLCQPSSNLS